MKRKNICVVSALAGALAIAGGCVSPTPPPTNQISPDADPLFGGISSQDVRSVAAQMTPALLAVPEIADSEDGEVVRILVSDFENDSRFMIDRNIFMERLITDLNTCSSGRVRFIQKRKTVSRRRTEALKDRQSKQLEKNLQKIASEIAASPLFSRERPAKVAVIPVLGTNLVNLNADSFVAMLRSEVANAAAGKIQFFMPGVMDGADYYLTGQFIAESMKTEGIINLANYIEVVDYRVKNGKSMYVVSDPVVETGSRKLASDGKISVYSPADVKRISLYENHLKKVLNDPALRQNPNVNKHLNVMIVDAKTKLSVFEKRFPVDRKVSDNSGNASLILSGKISGMHARKNGVNSDYLLITVSLTDIESNELLWQRAYEVKRLSESGIVYR